MIATARNPQQASKDHPDIEARDGKWLKLDVGEADAQEIVEHALKDLDGIDVLVNNAGISFVGQAEDARFCCLLQPVS